MPEHDEYAAIAEIYDSVVPLERLHDVAFFVAMAREYGGPVLEIGCGSGRVLIPTARAGVPIIGLDLSPAMLECCEAKLHEEPVEVQSKARLILGDMRRFELDRKFHLVTAPFRPFQHLASLEDQLSCLASIHRHLEEGGRLILDLFNPDLRLLVDEKFLEEQGSDPEIELADGRTILRRQRIRSRDPFNQVQDCELIYYVTHPDGRRERVVHNFRMRYLFRFEAEHLLVRSRFIVEQLYGDYDRSPYGSKYPGELIFIARKR